MKVLWFSNTSANSDEYFNNQLSGTGGWLKALDKAIQEKVELHVAFYHNENIGSFRHGKTTYHPIRKYKHLFEEIKTLLFNEIIDTKHIDIYLNIINKIQPDIIDIHGTENPFGCILGKTEIPIALTIQGNVTVCLHKFCSGIESNYLRLKRIRVSNPKTLLFPHSFQKKRSMFIKMQLLEERNWKNCKYCIGRTDWDRRISRLMAPKRGYFHNDRILRDGFYHTKWVHKNKKKLILHTTNGNLFHKGFETLCLSLNELNKFGIDCEWRVAGIRENDLIVKVVKKKLKSKFPNKNLVYLGPLTEDALILKMLEADIYVMTSHIENSPNNLCEAMILGMPCIATFVGGTGSLLTDGQEGILIQNGDPWAMAGAVLELKENFTKAIEMGQNARRRALKRHDKAENANKLLKIYSDIINLSRKK